MVQTLSILRLCLWLSVYPQLDLARLEGYLVEGGTEGEVYCAAFADAFRTDLDLAAARFDNLLDDCQAQADPLMVHLGASVQLAESREELWDVFARDAHSSVLHRHSQHLLTHVVLCPKLYRVIALTKFHTVLHQIYQHLLEAALITQQISRQPLRI